jgi:hypothetical protein
MVESLVVKDEQQSWQQFSGHCSWHGAIALDHCQELPLISDLNLPVIFQIDSSLW